VELSRCGTLQLVRRFRLHNQALIDEHIETLRRKPGALVPNRNAHLAFATMLTSDELMFHRSSVQMLEKAEAPRVVHLEERADDGIGQPLFNQLLDGHWE